MHICTNKTKINPPLSILFKMRIREGGLLVLKRVLCVIALINHLPLLIHVLATSFVLIIVRSSVSDFHTSVWAHCPRPQYFLTMKKSFKSVKCKISLIFRKVSTIILAGCLFFRKRHKNINFTVDPRLTTPFCLHITNSGGFTQSAYSGKKTPFHYFELN